MNLGVDFGSSAIRTAFVGPNGEAILVGDGIDKFNFDMPNEVLFCRDGVWVGEAAHLMATQYDRFVHLSDIKHRIFRGDSCFEFEGEKIKFENVLAYLLKRIVDGGRIVRRLAV